MAKLILRALRIILTLALPFGVAIVAYGYGALALRVFNAVLPSVQRDVAVWFCATSLMFTVRAILPKLNRAATMYYSCPAPVFGTTAEHLTGTSIIGWSVLAIICATDPTAPQRGVVIVLASLCAALHIAALIVCLRQNDGTIA